MSTKNKRLIEQYQEMHKSSKYGQTARSASVSLRLCFEKLQPKSVLEYGCGQSSLHTIFAKPDMVYDRYDPAVEGLTEIPRGNYDFLINTDVLEHIPEEDLAAVISEFRSLSEHAYIRISTRLARRTLPNGENAHCTVWPGGKWLDYIRRFYPEAEMPFEEEGEYCLILTWKNDLGSEIRAVEEKWTQRKKCPLRKLLKGAEKIGRKVRDAVISGGNHKS